MIRIEALQFAYPRDGFQLRIPELTVPEAQKLAVIGPSGSGKTTLLNLIAGIQPPDAGEIHVAGQPVHALGDAARRNFRISRVGFIFQDFELLDYLSVFDNILHPYRISAVLRLNTEVRKRAQELAMQMGIDDKLGRTVGELSQGEKQRTAICRALLPRPRLILADEATGNLDPENKLHILDLLFQAVDRDGATLLAVTHDHELLPRFDRVIDFAAFRAGDIE